MCQKLRNPSERRRIVPFDHARLIGMALPMIWPETRCGPLSKTIDPSVPVPANPQADGYGYNPRCLRRDVNNYFTVSYLRPVDIANHLNSTSDINTFQTTLQTDTTSQFSLHTAGHYTSSSFLFFFLPSSLLFLILVRLECEYS